jgi:hypothetical protein
LLRLSRSGLLPFVLPTAMALGAAAPVAAQAPRTAPSGAVLVDGLAVLAGGGPAEEDEATPISVSQLELEADLLLIRRHGQDWIRVAADDQLRRQARRVAALVRLLARQARQMGESVSDEDREAVLVWLEERAGGSGAMDALLARRGTDRDDLTAWAEDALLAEAQVAFIADRSDRSEDRGDSDRGAKNEDGPPQEQGEARRTARAWHTREALAEWLAATLERALLRLLP